MKKIKSIYYLLFLIGLSVLSSCRKTVENHGSGNPPVDTTVNRKFQLLLDSLPGEVAGATNLSAIISIANTQNDTIVVNRKLSLKYNGKYFTDTITLSKGQYRVTKFWIIQPDNKVQHATPLAGSAKASLVSKALPLSIMLQDASHKQVPIQVIKVNSTDLPENFGYPTGSFGNKPPEDPNSMIKIRVHPLIRIGEVVYDSIPVTMTVLTWSNSGAVNTTTHTLSPGTNELWLSKAATKYQLRISKWGTYDEMNLMRGQVQEGELYSLGGTKAAKKLTEVLTYQLVNDSYQPQTRTIYQYAANGSINQIQLYKKRPDLSNYLAETENFEYSGNKVQRIKRYNEANTLIETTGFSYGTDGKLVHVSNLAGNNQTQATVQYTVLGGGTGISGNHLISANYQYSFLPYSMYYNMSIQGGVVRQSTKATTHGNSEAAHYQYDYSINPFIHLSVPDLYLSNYSKHNKVAEQKTYVGHYPVSAPYSFSYTYDSDGYPVELITKYKAYLSGQHAYTTKTVYKY